MIVRTVVFAGIALCFAALVVPSADEEGDEDYYVPITQSGGSQTRSSASPSTSDWNAGGHTLQRQSDGHFYASAYVDGAQVNMMVDTGASVIALTGRDAAAIGLQWDETQVRNIGRGASGAVYGVPTLLNEVDIGGITRRNVSAVIIPRGLDVSLLGQSYLQQIGAVEIADDKMILGAG